MGEILGYVDTIKNPNFIRMNYGEGVIYLHSNPMAFTNFFLLDSVHGDYYQRALSFLPPATNVVWDEYLKSGAEGQQTLFRVIFRYPALKWAYILLILGAILYVLFRNETGTASDSGNSSFGKPDIGIRIGCEFSVLQAAGSCCYCE